MKNIIIIISVFLSTVAFGQKEPIKVDKGFKIEVQTSAICGMCKNALEESFAFEKGIKKANLNLDDKVMSVIYNPKKTNAETIRKRIISTGYHADNLARNEIAYKNLPMCCKDGAHGTPVPQVPLKTKEEN